MKKMILLLLVVLIVTPMVSYSYGFLNITNAQLSRLDASTFRLRVTYDWGGEWVPAQITDANWYGPQMPGLESFGVTGGGTQFNVVNDTIPGALYRSGASRATKSIGNLFGYDFNADDPLVSSFTFLYQGSIAWNESSQSPNGSDISTQFCFSRSFDGSFTLPANPSSVPEPASLLLLGLGLVGAIIVKRRK